jgi:hypothetical protein
VRDPEEAGGKPQLVRFVHRFKGAECAFGQLLQKVQQLRPPPGYGRDVRGIAA